jgi:hypothetical protein
MIDLIPNKAIPFADIFDGRLGPYGVYEFHPREKPLHGGRVLMFGERGLIVYPDHEGNLGRVDPCGFFPSISLEKIFTEVFSTKIIWGNAKPSQEELDESKAEHQSYQDWWMTELMAELDSPGSSELTMDWNQIKVCIARALLAEDPLLAKLCFQKEWFDKIHERYFAIQKLFEIRFYFLPSRDQDDAWVDAMCCRLMDRYPDLQDKQLRDSRRSWVSREESDLLDWIRKNSDAFEPGCSDPWKVAEQVFLRLRDHFYEAEMALMESDMQERRRRARMTRLESFLPQKATEIISD